MTECICYVCKKIFYSDVKLTEENVSEHSEWLATTIRFCSMNCIREHVSKSVNKEFENVYSKL